MTAPRTHHLKTSAVFFAFIWSGDKTFEIRKNDREFRVGDRAVLAETRIVQALPSPFGVMVYTGRAVFAEITYLTEFQQKPEYIVFAFREISRSSTPI